MREELLKIISDEKRVITEKIEKKYLSDNLERRIGSAKAVIFPVSTQEISELLKYAYANQIPVTPRGAGTNLVGSTVPRGDGIVVDVSLMNHILELDEKTFTATVEPGVILQDFQTFVEAKREDCSKKSTVLKAHKYSTFGKILSIRKTQDVGISRPICC